MSHALQEARYENITPDGHMVVGEFNPLTQLFECHVLDKKSGAKILLSEEAKEGITAALAAEREAVSVTHESDEWAQTVHQVKMRQAAYLKQLVGVYADMAVDRSISDRVSAKELWRESRKLMQSAAS